MEDIRPLIELSIAISPDMPRYDGDPRKDRGLMNLKRNSIESNAYMNETFFEQAQAVVQTQSQTWKSSQAKQKEQFERRKNLIKHVAPEQFRDPARPSNGPCKIVPTNVQEWTQHLLDMQVMAIEEAKRNLRIIEERSKAGPDAKLPIRSAFELENGKVNDGYSAVLFRPSIWSNKFETAQIRPTAAWPGQAELHMDGDGRENPNAKTRCRRFLPGPRLSLNPTVPFVERPFIKQFPLDQTGNLYTYGPSYLEFSEANRDMDNDPDFEAVGESYLGDDFMEELGYWQEPCVPDWLKEQKEQELLQQYPHLYSIEFVMPSDWYL